MKKNKIIAVLSILLLASVIYSFVQKTIADSAIEISHNQMDRLNEQENRLKDAELLAEEKTKEVEELRAEAAYNAMRAQVSEVKALKNE